MIPKMENAQVTQYLSLLSDEKVMLINNNYFLVFKSMKNNMQGLCSVLLCCISVIWTQ